MVRSSVRFTSTEPMRSVTSAGPSEIARPGEASPAGVATSDARNELPASHNPAEAPESARRNWRRVEWRDAGGCWVFTPYFLPQSIGEQNGEQGAAGEGRALRWSALL